MPICKLAFSLPHPARKWHNETRSRIHILQSTPQHVAPAIHPVHRVSPTKRWISGNRTYRRWIYPTRIYVAELSGAIVIGIHTVTIARTVRHSTMSCSESVMQYLIKDQQCILTYICIRYRHTMSTGGQAQEFSAGLELHECDLGLLCPSLWGIQFPKFMRPEAVAGWICRPRSPVSGAAWHSSAILNDPRLGRAILVTLLTSCAPALRQLTCTHDICNDPIVPNIQASEPRCTMQQADEVSCSVTWRVYTWPTKEHST